MDKSILVYDLTMPISLETIDPEIRQIVEDHQQLRIITIFRVTQCVILTLVMILLLIDVLAGLLMVLGLKHTFLTSDCAISDPAVMEIVGWRLFLSSGIRALIILLILTLSGLAAYGNYKRKWYWLCFITACFELFILPYGTLVGVVALMNYKRLTVKALFNRQASGLS